MHTDRTVLCSGSDDGYELWDRGKDVVGEYEGRPLSGLWTHHRRPESVAGDSKQPARTKPKGFALAALCEG